MRGTGLAGICSFSTNLLIVIVYSCLKPELSETFVALDGRAFQDLWTYLKLGAPMVLQACMNLWIWEIQVLISGFFSIEEQSSQIILMQILIYCFMFAVGLEASTCAMIGNLLGKQKITEAQQTYTRFKVVALVFGIFNCLFFFFLQGPII